MGATTGAAAGTSVAAGAAEDPAAGAVAAGAAEDPDDVAGAALWPDDAELAAGWSVSAAPPQAMISANSNDSAKSAAMVGFPAM